MQTKRTVIQDYLKKNGNFTFRNTENGFKMNLKELNKEDLVVINAMPFSPDIKVKRSGAGLVVLVTIPTK